ncbi:tumor protein p53-inducible protein 13 isoform X3 [Arvicanthis niloticus]|uniref:tumor protein p53-inducible protein 13 isoform X3 n=1 Tax=Arvicanthis niloticus TaxID=61156 RepID=UPI00402B6B49
MVPPPPPPPRLLLVALVGLLSLHEVRRPASGKVLAGGSQSALLQLCPGKSGAREGIRRPLHSSAPLLEPKGRGPRRGQRPALPLDPQVVAEPAEKAGTPCPEGLWPLPPQVLPRVTYTQVRQGQAEGITFFYHPCAHPWLKLRLAVLAHVCVSKPTLIPDFSLTWDRPLVLTAWGASLEMAWIEPAWVVHWLKRRRRRKQRKNVWFLSDNRFGPTPMMPASRRGKLCGRWCVQAPTLAFALRSWRPPGTEVTSRGPRRSSISVVRRRGLRAALGLQSTPSGLRVSLASSQSLKAQQPTLGTSSVAPVSSMTGGPGGNEARVSTGGPRQTARTLWLLS